MWKETTATEPDKTTAQAATGKNGNRRRIACVFGSAAQLGTSSAKIWNYGTFVPPRSRDPGIAGPNGLPADFIVRPVIDVKLSRPAANVNAALAHDRPVPAANALVTVPDKEQIVWSGSYHGAQ